MASKKNQTDQRRHRFHLVLVTLGERGVSQHEVGLRTGVGAQYVSDVKTGRRALTELFGRRLAAEFGTDLQWLLTGTGGSRRPATGKTVGRALSPLAAAVLPVLPELVQGDPCATAHWDGSTVELTGHAAIAAAAQAADPYVLRLGHGDRDGRLRVGDLVLISQKADRNAALAVVRAGESLRLARLGKAGTRRDLETGRPIPQDARVVGHCVAVIWGPL